MNHSSFKPIGLLGINEKGKYIFVSVENLSGEDLSGAVGSVVSFPPVVFDSSDEGGIAEALDPAEERADKERAKDVSLDGIIKKHHEVSKEELPE